jgi:hypothetical protein
MEIIDLYHYKDEIARALEKRLGKPISSVRIKTDENLKGKDSVIGVTMGMLYFKIPPKYEQLMKYGELDPDVFVTSIAKWHWNVESAPEHSLESLKAFLENFSIGWKKKGEYTKPQTYRKYHSPKPENWRR